MKWTERCWVKLSKYIWELKSQPEKEKKEYQPWMGMAENWFMFNAANQVHDSQL